MEIIPQIKLCEPIFSVYSCQILYCDYVTIITPRTTENRLLLVSTVGVFVFQQRSFPKSIIKKDFINYPELSSIRVEHQCITLASPTHQIQFQHVDQLSIASRIVSARCTLFNPKHVPLSLSIAVSLKEQFQNQSYNYTTNYILADRFLSNVMSFQLPVTAEKVEQTYSYLAAVKDTVVISKEIIDLPYLPAIVASLEIEMSITKLVVMNVRIPKCYKLFCRMLRQNPAITTVTFSNMFIDGDFKLFSESLSTTKAKVAEWIFLSCSLDSNDFKPFLESFRNYKNSIKTLIFNECNFSQETFSYFIQRFFFIDCFHSLESFWLSEIVFQNDVLLFLCQLFASDWVLKNHTLKNLVIPRCCIQLDNLLKQMQSFETGITTADFSGNLFINPPPIDMAANFSQQVNFVLNKCGFAGNTFSILMQALAAHKGQTMRLDISDASSSPESWTTWAQKAPSIVFRSLTTLIWDCNPINKEFCQFLANQPNLKKLSISDCINNDNSQDLLPELKKLFSVKTFDSLTIRATRKQFALGYPLIECIMVLINRRTLADLDITNQEVTEEGILNILESMPMIMKALRFDGNGIRHSDILISILVLILKKKLSYASWPEKDTQKTIEMISNADAVNELKMKLDVLKKQFDERFSSTSNRFDDDNPLSVVHKYTKMFKEIPQEPSPQLITGKFDRKHSTTDETGDFKVPDETLEALLKECNQQAGKDPMYAMLKTLENETTIEALSSHIIRNEHEEKDQTAANVNL